LLPPIAPLLSPKHALREKMKAERRAAAKARPDAAVHAAKNFLAAIEIPAGGVVALYHPLRDELGTEPVAAALAERGVQLALPAVSAKNAPLEFRPYAFGLALEKGAHGTLVPAETAENLRPDILVAPLLAFTRAGGRLGYGGGYYDRTIEALREEGPLVVVGYAYGAQEVTRLPADGHDQMLDWIVTERGAWKCGA
jgi:5-formyltetrahydrofolate cyclo-ligase